MKMRKAMIDIVIDKVISRQQVPPMHELESAVEAACRVARLENDHPDLCLRFSDDETIRALNKQWRNRDEPTDVLSFPMQAGPDDAAGSYLGDIIFSCPSIQRAAHLAGIDSNSHTQHLVIHGVLHLLKYDHIRGTDTNIMQNAEREAMRLLGLHDPYP